MTAAGPTPAFAPDAYVVRYGGRVALRAAACLPGGLAIGGYAIVTHRSVTADVIALLVALILIGVAIADLTRMARRTVAFAVHQGGVYFGSGRVKDDVPWSRICAVELFTETHTTHNSQNRYRCIGVRSQGTTQISRPGNGVAARPVDARTVQYLIDAGRPDLIPGADGTIRYAYRQLSGWRVDQAQLVAAVARFSPGVPVVNGPNFPPAIARADEFAARRAKRARGGSRF